AGGARRQSLVSHGEPHPADEAWRLAVRGSKIAKRHVSTRPPGAVNGGGKRVRGQPDPALRRVLADWQFFQLLGITVDAGYAALLHSVQHFIKRAAAYAQDFRSPQFVASN